MEDNNVGNGLDDPGKDLDKKTPQLFGRSVYLVAAAALLLVVVAFGIYTGVVLTNRSADGEAAAAEATGGAAAGEEVTATAEVLPQLRRDNNQDETATSVEGPFTDPFAAPMLLTGIVIGGRGGAMAIIESGDASYIVAVGDYVDDLWAVLQIAGEMVVLRAGDQEVRLFLNQPQVTVPLQRDLRDEATEEGA